MTCKAQIAVTIEIDLPTFVSGRYFNERKAHEEMAALARSMVPVIAEKLPTGMRVVGDAHLVSTIMPQGDGAERIPA